MSPDVSTQRVPPTYLPRAFVLEFEGDPLSLQTRLMRGIRKLRQLGYEVEVTMRDDLAVITAKRCRPPRRAFSRLRRKA